MSGTGLPVITTKRDLAAYLRENDPETLAFFKTCAEVFGPAEVVAYAARPGAKMVRGATECRGDDLVLRKFGEEA